MGCRPGCWCSKKSIQRFLARTGGVAAKAWHRSARQLSLRARRLLRGLLAGLSLRAIATRLAELPRRSARGPQKRTAAVSISSLGRECCCAPCPPTQAVQARCERQAAGGVEQKLSLRWSPQQISAGWCTSSQTTRRCGCRTRPSQVRSTSRRAALCARSSPLPAHAQDAEAVAQAHRVHRDRRIREMVMISSALLRLPTVPSRVTGGRTSSSARAATRHRHSGGEAQPVRDAHPLAKGAMLRRFAWR